MRRRRRAAVARADRPALAHRLADLRHVGLRGRRPPRAQPVSPTACWPACHCVELDLGGGFGIAYTTQDDPADPQTLADDMRAIVEHECRALGIAVPRLSIEPGRAIAGPSTFTLYEVGTVKPVALDAGASRLYVAVDGGMSDNIRPALYDADFSCTLASRRSDAAPVLVASRRASTASPATSSSRTSSCPATSRRATCSPCRPPVPTADRWPAPTTTCPGRPSSPCAPAGPP